MVPALRAHSVTTGDGNRMGAPRRTLSTSEYSVAEEFA